MIIKALRGALAKDMAIDLGTANMIIYVDGQGIVLNEPSVVAIETMTNNQKRVCGIGHGAKAMDGVAPRNINVIRPMRDGVIADYEVTAQMLNQFIKKVHGARFFTPAPRIVICVPTSATPVDRRAIRESAEAAGANKAFLIDETMAAAIGSGLPVHEAAGSMVLDIGGGTAEVGVISLGGLVYSKSVKVGGDKIDQAIIEYVRAKFGIAIGERTSEKVKKQIALAHKSLFDSDAEEIRVSGQHVGEGVPRAFTLSSQNIYEAIENVLLLIVQATREALQNVPPELSSDISERGISLTGGGALIRGLDVMIKEKTGVSVHVAEDPLACVARGCGAALKYIDNERIFNIFS